MACTSPGSSVGLLTPNNAEESAMDGQPCVGVVVDETKLSELVHEVVDARAGRAHHLRQMFLVDPGHHRLGLATLAKM